MMNIERFKGIEAFLFDLGGVIIDIDARRTVNRFKELGFMGIEDQITQSHHDGLFKDFERGDIGEDQFLEALKKQVDSPLDDEVLMDAWNSILGEFPVERLHILEQLHYQYPTYLLSNTNSIHLRKFRRMGKGYKDLEELFTAAFYSFRLGCSKPEHCAFQKVIVQTGLIPEATLFLDDSETNLKAAAELGFKTQLVTKQNPMERIFK